MTEKLIIENFAGIKHFEIELNQINVFIGPQATGKSVCAKLFYFFKKFQSVFVNGIEKELTLKETEEKIIKKFTDYFPIHTYLSDSFNIKYTIGDKFIEIKKKNGNATELKYSDFFKNYFKKYKDYYSKKLKEENKKESEVVFDSAILLRRAFKKEFQKEIGQPAGYNQYFIPAGRSFFANFQQSIFSNDAPIDPILKEFGSIYEGMKVKYFISDLRTNIDVVNDLIEKIICGKYTREKGEDFLVHPDGRKVNISYSSSGQQETLPLAVILKSFLRLSFIGEGATVYIEEPEAHLFPSAQKSIVELITYIFNHPNKDNKFQFIITTHSPYILTAFNNLIQAGSIYPNLNKAKRNELNKIINTDLILSPEVFNAYSLDYNEIKNIISKETGLISTNEIDSVSNDIAIQFDDLLKFS